MMMHNAVERFSYQIIQNPTRKFNHHKNLVKNSI